MAKLFQRSSDTWFRLAIGAGAVLFVAAFMVPIVYVRTPYNENRDFPVDQPVQFDHRHHVRDDQIDCRYCHDNVERSPYAGIPATEVCMGCHNQVWPKSVMLEPVRRSYFSGEPLRWNRVHRLPDFVYFNHSAHIKIGVGCVSCHGRVDEMALDYQVEPLTMGWCLGCHRHPASRLRPPQEVTSMTWTPTAESRAAAERVAARLDEKQLTSCTTCHR